MRALVALATALLAASSAHAHPGSGLVVDREGNVYFVILGSNAIMRWSPDGRATTFVNDERLRLPHHLVLGADGALYAASDNTGNVWRIARDGSLSDYFVSAMVPRPRGRPELHVGSWGDPFTIDAAGNVYALAFSGAPEIVRVTPEGEVTRLASGVKFGDLHFSSMAWGPDGALYVTDSDKVWRVAGDSGRAIVPRGGALSGATGLALDSAGNIYVADYRAGRIVRLAADGAENTPTSIAELGVRQPVAVAVAGSDVYVVESRPFVTVLWRVSGDRAERLYTRRDPRLYAQWAFFVALALLPVLVIARYWQRRAT